MLVYLLVQLISCSSVVIRKPGVLLQEGRRVRATEQGRKGGFPGRITIRNIDEWKKLVLKSDPISS